VDFYLIPIGLSALDLALVRVTVNRPLREEVEMIEYRKSKDKDVWHWVHSCSKWPTFDYEVIRAEPTWGTKCEECKQKQTPDDVNY